MTLDDAEKEMKENPDGEIAQLYERILVNAFAAYKEKYGLPERLRR